MKEHVHLGRQNLFHLQQLVLLGRLQPLRRDARPLGDNVGNGLGGDVVGRGQVAFRGVILALASFEGLESRDGVWDRVVSEIGSGRQVVIALGLLCLSLQVFYLLTAAEQDSDMVRIAGQSHTQIVCFQQPVSTSRTPLSGV
jgi:hypothetical protein